MACTKEKEGFRKAPSQPIEDEWLIPSDQVFDGGPGKDGIPSIDNPDFTLTAEVSFLKDEDLVLGIAFDGVIKAYPHPILDWHEIVNDEFGELSLAITYCPLTGTGVAWNRVIEGELAEFGVSGLLYNTNLMPYDRITNSVWSQQRLDCVNGELKGTTAKVHSLVEMPWSVWKEAFPEALVLNTRTGYSRNYARYPYGDYRTNQRRLLFPIRHTDDRLPLKERVLGVVYSSEQKVYLFDDGQQSIDMILDEVAGRQIAIVRSKVLNVLAAFELRTDRTYELKKDGFPNVIADSQGNVYDILGRCTHGNAAALNLSPQFMGYWFSWGTFYPEIPICGF